MKKRIRFLGISSVCIPALMAIAGNQIVSPFGNAELPNAVPKSVSDGAHDGDNDHFYFLPPMVGMPAYTGVFYDDLSPVMTITPAVVHTGASISPASGCLFTTGSDAHNLDRLGIINKAIDFAQDLDLQDQDFRVLK